VSFEGSSGLCHATTQQMDRRWDESDSASLETINVNILARDQLNDLRVLGLCECSVKEVILTIETYKKYYLFVLKSSEY
jgi:hypothetical protein